MLFTSPDYMPKWPPSSLLQKTRAVDTALPDLMRWKNPELYRVVILLVLNASELIIGDSTFNVKSASK